MKSTHSIAASSTNQKSERSHRIGQSGTKRILLATTLLLAMGAFAPFARAADPPKAEQTVVAAQVPVPAINPVTKKPYFWRWILDVPADNGKKQAAAKVDVNVVGIPAIPGLDIIIDREITRFSKFKALAIADSINENKNAQKYNIKATVEDTTGNITRWNWKKKAWEDVKGIALSKVVVTGAEKLRQAGDPTKESFNDKRIPPPPNNPPPGGSMDTMKPRKVSLSTGVDPDGAPSIVSFGLVLQDGTGSSDMTYLVATAYPEEGEAAGQVMASLADQFNEQFASEGYTVTYDPATNRLTTDQLIPWGIGFEFGNTDTGLDFDFDMVTGSAF